MTTFLLDANALIALTIAEHEHHERASDWLATVEAFAVSPVVEGALVRFLVRIGEAVSTATSVLAGVRAAPRCAFWTDDLTYLDVDLDTVRGYRQVTDTYLAALAKHHGGRLATFDVPLAQRVPRDCLLIP